MTTTTRATHVHNRAADQPFGDTREFLRAVRASAVTPELTDVRLRAQNTNIGAEGGHAVPESLLERLHSAVLADAVLYPRTSQRTVTQGNGYDGVVIDESARMDGERHGGAALPVVAQDATFSYTAPSLRRVQLGLTKFGSIIPATNELVEDAEGLAEDFETILGGELAFMLDRLVAYGRGGAEPIGLANAHSTITVAIEATQTIANTPEFIRINTAKMLGQVRRLSRAVFYLHPDLIAGALVATVGGAANGAAPLFGPPTDDAPLGTLHNRPFFPLESAPAVGSVGDMLCCDPTRYLLAQKGGLRQAVSMHAQFLSDVSLFRFSVRVNGCPFLSRSVTAFNGSLPKSDAVVLAART